MTTLRITRDLSTQQTKMLNEDDPSLRNVYIVPEDVRYFKDDVQISKVEYERELSKLLREQYKDYATHHARELMVNVMRHGSVNVCEHGAYVDAVIWVPKEKLSE